MSLFKRLLNPIWEKVDQLPPATKLDFCMPFLLFHPMRDAIARECVEPTRRLLTEPGPALDILQAKGIDRRQITQAEQNALTSRAFLGILTCMHIPEDAPQIISRNRLQMIPEVLGALELADVRAPDNKNAAVTLDAVGYSNQPDECRTQVVLSWAEILSIDPSSFVPIVSAAMAEKWDTVAGSILRGMLVGAGRTPPAMIFDRAKSEFKSMPPQRAAIARYAATAAARGR